MDPTSSVNNMILDVIVDKIIDTLKKDCKIKLTKGDIYQESIWQGFYTIPSCYIYFNSYNIFSNLHYTKLIIRLHSRELLTIDLEHELLNAVDRNSRVCGWIFKELDELEHNPNFDNFIETLRDCKNLNICNFLSKHSYEFFSLLEIIRKIWKNKTEGIF